MRILVVNNNFDVKNGGGAERYVLDIIEGLKGRGHTVYTSTGDGHLNESDVVYVNNCFNTSLIERLTTRPAIRFIHDHQLYCPGTPKYWFNSQCQCCINTDPRCIYYAFTQHCLSRNPKKFIPAVFGKRAEIGANKGFAKLVVASDFMKKMLVENGFDEASVVVNSLFPYSKDLSFRQPKQPKQPMVLYVGRVFKEKGVDYLIRACALLKEDFRLVVVGTGWDLERCQALVKELRLEEKIDFLGFQPPEKIAPLYQAARLVAVPSVWPEPFCLIGIEAGSYKKPVVAFDSGGISQWLKNGESGFLVPRLDTRKLAQKIDILLEDKKLAEKMGQEGYNRVRREFTFERHLDELEKVFDEVVKKS